MSKCSSLIHLIFAGLLLLISLTSTDGNLESCAIKDPISGHFCVALQSKRRNLLGYIGLHGERSKHVYVKKPNHWDLHQQWLAKPNLDGSLKLQNRNSTWCLCVRGEEQYWDGYRAHSCHCKNSNSQQNWRLEPVAGNETCVYRLQSNYHQGYVFPSILLQRVHADMREVKRGSTKGNWKVRPCGLLHAKPKN